MNYYVYYKIDPAQAKELAPKIAELFDLVKAQTGIHGRWMRRRDDPSTYMEVFEGVRDEAAFEALLEREGAKLGLERKVERFIPAERPS
jgi:quinol monooxygenase YgiN